MKIVNSTGKSISEQDQNLLLSKVKSYVQSTTSNRFIRESFLLENVEVLCSWDSRNNEVLIDLVKSKQTQNSDDRLTEFNTVKQIRQYLKDQEIDIPRSFTRKAQLLTLIK